MAIAQLHFNSVALHRLLHNQILIIHVLSPCKRFFINLHIRSLKAAIEIQEQSQEDLIVLNADKKASGEHILRFNLPTGSEVAVISPVQWIDGCT